MRNINTRGAAAAFGLLLALAGCDQIDPLKRPYMWHENGANAHNIAAMAANPADLTRGRGDRSYGAYRASAAVENLWNGKPTPFIGSGASGASGGGAAPSTGKGY